MARSSVLMETGWRIRRISTVWRKGLLYRKVYANAPVCAPSRFCLLTGINPESNGPAHPMRAAGYYCTNNETTD